MPVLLSFHDWAETWLPEDPEMVDRDPDVVLGWLTQRVAAHGLTAPVVLEIWPRGQAQRYWLVLQAGAGAYGCLTDPLLDVSRYIYVHCATATLLALARGRLGWKEAQLDGALTTVGAADLRAQVADWFLPAVVPANAVRS
jgi:hypothetical protein